MSSPSLRAVGYVRVSTEDQNPESQKVYLQKYAQEHNIELVAIFEDVAVSGYEVPPFSRTGFRKAYELAKQLRCPILTISLDRISREADTLLSTLMQLEREGIEVWTIQEEWLRRLSEITDETLRKVIYRMLILALGYAYEMYVKSVREKTRAGLERARREGKRVGRPSPMHDPSKQELFRIVVCEKKVPYRKAAQMLGLSLKQVEYWAKKLCK